MLNMHQHYGSYQETVTFFALASIWNAKPYLIDWIFSFASYCVFKLWTYSFLQGFNEHIMNIIHTIIRLQF